MPYAIVLFLHIAGAVATFVGVGVLFFAALTLRRATRTEEVRSIAGTYEMGSALGLTGILVVAATGLYMAATVWGLSRGWVLVAIGAFALMAPVGPVIVAPRIERVMGELRNSADGPLSPALVGKLSDPIPKLGLLVVIGDLVGIVFVMTVKPSAWGSIVAILGFVALASSLGLPTVGRIIAAAVHFFAEAERRGPLYRR